MANVELKHERTGRKVTVNEAVVEYYAAHGWAEAPKKTRTASTKARSEDADSDAGEGATATSKTTKRGSNTAS